jgi:hypothetical protein
MSREDNHIIIQWKEISSFFVSLLSIEKSNWARDGPRVVSLTERKGQCESEVKETIPPCNLFKVFFVSLIVARSTVGPALLHFH